MSDFIASSSKSNMNIKDPHAHKKGSLKISRSDFHHVIRAGPKMNI